MADVLRKIISDKDFVNGACITTATPLSNTTKNRLAQKINDNTGIGSISGILDTRFDDSIYYSGDASAGGGATVEPSIRSVSTDNSLPSGTEDGDLVILMAMNSNKAQSAPAGFSTLMNTQVGFRGFSVFYKIASSEPSNYTVTNAANYRVISVQNVDQTTPVRHSDEGSIGVGTSETFTPLTLTRSGLLIIYFGAQTDNSPTMAVTSGAATIQTSMYTSSGNDRGLASISMDELQDIGYSEDVVISRDNGAGRYAKIAIQPPV